MADSDLIVNLPVWVAWTRWISPYFYGFNWIARTQFIGRTFECVGITGPARNACDGTAVLVGLGFSLSTPLFVYPLGLLGFIMVCNLLATVVLETYHPGGVKQAAQQASSDISTLQVIREEQPLEEKKKIGVAVKVEGLTLSVVTRSLFKKEAKCLLDDLSFEFPANQVTCIMGPSGAGKSSLLQLLAVSFPAQRFPGLIRALNDIAL